VRVALRDRDSTRCRPGVAAKARQDNPTQDCTIQDAASACAQQDSQLSGSRNKEADAMRSDHKEPFSPAPPRPAASALSPQTPSVTEDAYSRQERLLDQALADTFPASDPVSVAAPYQGFGNS
jgi:hypothetical protein